MNQPFFNQFFKLRQLAFLIVDYFYFGSNLCILPFYKIISLWNGAKRIPILGVLAGFLFQVKDMINARNRLRKATKYISGHTIKKISRIFSKFSSFFRVFRSIFFWEKYINLNFNEKSSKLVKVISSFNFSFAVASILGYFR